MEISLSEKEYKHIESIMKNYRSIDADLTSVQIKLESLIKQKNELLKRLDTIKQDEDEFFTEIRNVYGEGSFDILSMKYKTKTD